MQQSHCHTQWQKGGPGTSTALFFSADGSFVLYGKQMFFKTFPGLVTLPNRLLLQEPIEQYFLPTLDDSQPS